MSFRVGQRVLVHVAPCEPQPGTVRAVLVGGQTLAIEWDIHPQNVPYFYAMASACTSLMIVRAE